VSPVLGLTLKERVTGRPKPLNECSVIVDVPVVPALTVTDRGEAVRLKYTLPAFVTVRVSQLLVAPLLFASPL
jgi:hypothetical protein